MNDLRQVIRDVQEKNIAIGHFNFSDLTGLRAIFEAARSLKLPVIVGTSEGEREFVGPREAAILVRNLRETYDYPIFLNADHTHSFEKAKEALEAGYDAILFDGGKLSLDENIRITKEVVAYVRSKNPSVLVEGEIGYIGNSSEILEELPEGAAITPDKLTTPEDAARFVRETGVDLLAPAVGNIHGILAHAAKPRLDMKRIEAIRKAVQVPLVLHGGSGNADDDFRAAIKAGMNIIHINTEIRLAWRKGVEAGLAASAHEVAPYKILTPALRGMEEVITQRLKLFAGLL